MLSKQIIIVNYHYIRAQSFDRGIHAIAVEDFEKQLDLISEEGFQFIALENLHRAIIDQTMEHLPQRSCLITFDDGLKESYLNGVPVLDRKGIPAVFYVATDAIVNKEVLSVHKFHYVRYKVQDEEILNLTRGMHDLSGIQIKEEVLREQYPWDTSLSAQLKYIFNFALSEEKKEQIVNRLFQLTYSADEHLYAEELYMSADQVSQLASRKYLGTHSQKHRVLSHLTKEELKNDINASVEALFSLTGERVDSISYPYGGHTAVNNDVGAACRELGMISGLTMFRGINEQQEIFSDHMLLKRLDMNDMIGGKSQNIYEELTSGV